MFTVSIAARDRLSTKLDVKNAHDEQAFRFTQCPDGWKLRLDQANPADVEYKHNGRTVLLLDAAISQAMANMALVVRKTDSGPRLKLRKTDAR